jgi:pentatricopeptide repeat protein
MEEALTLFHEMMRNNYSPSHRTCNTIIKGFCINGRLDDAINMLDFMIENDMDPNAISYNILLKEFCKEDRMEDARKLYAAATKRGVFPNYKHSSTECR